MSTFENKNYSIQLFRLIASIMVIAIHTAPLSEINRYLGSAVIIFSRVAVPIFFVLSGYFYKKKIIEDNNYLKKYLIKIVKIYLSWSLIYLPYSLIEYSKSNQMLSDYIKEILINGTYLHLWYLPAVIIGLTMYHILNKRVSKSNIIALGIFLYIVCLLGMTYYGILEGLLKNIFDKYFLIFLTTRNGVFFGFPYILLGTILYDEKKQKYEIKELILKITIALIAVFIEYLLIYKMDISKSNDLCVFMPILIYYLSIFLLKDSLNKISKYILEKINYEDYSLGIYLVHGIYLIIFLEIFKAMNIKNYGTTYFLLVTIFSVGTIYKYKIKKNQKILTKVESK